MLNFKPITLESRRDLLPFLGKKHHSACYQSFATMYLWSSIYKTRYCMTDEWLFTKSGSSDGYGFPYGDGDLREGIALLRQDAKENGKKLWFFGLLEEQKAWLEQLLQPLRGRPPRLEIRAHHRGKPGGGAGIPQPLAEGKRGQQRGPA